MIVTSWEFPLWAVTDSALQALLRTVLKKLRYLLCRRSVNLMEDMRIFESVYLMPNELFLYSPKLRLFCQITRRSLPLLFLNFNI